MSDLESLKTAKAALDAGLITQADFDSVKDGFIAAQKLKTGVDAGLLRKEDYDKSRDAFLELMGVGSSTTTANKPQVKRNSNVTTHTTPAANAPSSKPAAPPPPARKPAPQAPKAPLKSSGNPKPSAASKGPTSMSGISVNSDAVAEFNNMKSRSEYKWMTFQINSTGTEVVLAETGNADATFEDFCGIFEENQCKYGVFDYPYDAAENRSFNKIVFFNWAPDCAPVKQKMMFASTKAFFKQSLDGIQVEMHVTDHTDLSDENVRTAIKATLTRQ
eukprot:g1917.t1